METNVAAQKIFYVDYTWKEMDALDRSKVILVLPSGSVEQHGPHLAMASDAAQAEYFSREAARRVKDAIVLPALWYSTCLDTSNYTGTISMPPSVFIEMIVAILTSLYRHGFKRLMIANVHGAAKTPLDVAVREFHARMGTRELKQHCALNEPTMDLLKMAMTDLNLSARAYDRILKVSRTIADLSAAENIGIEHIAEAVQYRSLDRKYWG